MSALQGDVFVETERLRDILNFEEGGTPVYQEGPAEETELFKQLLWAYDQRSQDSLHHSDFGSLERQAALADEKQRAALNITEKLNVALRNSTEIVRLVSSILGSSTFTSRARQEWNLDSPHRMGLLPAVPVARNVAREVMSVKIRMREKQECLIDSAKTILGVRDRLNESMEAIQQESKLTSDLRSKWRISLFSGTNEASQAAGFSGSRIVFDCRCRTVPNATLVSAFTDLDGTRRKEVPKTSIELDGQLFRIFQSSVNRQCFEMLRSEALRSPRMGSSIQYSTGLISLHIYGVNMAEAHTIKLSLIEGDDLPFGVGLPESTISVTGTSVDISGDRVANWLALAAVNRTAAVGSRTSSILHLLQDSVQAFVYTREVIALLVAAAGQKYQLKCNPYTALPVEDIRLTLSGRRPSGEPHVLSSAPPCETWVYKRGKARSVVHRSILAKFIEGVVSP